MILQNFLIQFYEIFYSSRFFYNILLYLEGLQFSDYSWDFLIIETRQNLKIYRRCDVTQNLYNLNYSLADTNSIFVLTWWDFYLYFFTVRTKINVKFIIETKEQLCWPNLESLRMAFNSWHPFANPFIEDDIFESCCCDGSGFMFYLCYFEAMIFFRVNVLWFLVILWSFEILQFFCLGTIWDFFDFFILSNSLRFLSLMIRIFWNFLIFELLCFF